MDAKRAYHVGMKSKQAGRNMNWRCQLSFPAAQPMVSWAEIRLRPDDQAYQGDFLLLTLLSLGAITSPEINAQAIQWMRKVLESLDQRQYHIEGAYMLVMVQQFTRAEVLDWTGTWLRESGLPAARLIEAPSEPRIPETGGDLGSGANCG
jgi:hypothetical protein